MTREKDMHRAKVCYAVSMLIGVKKFLPIYIDEYAVNDTTTRKYTWAPKGRPHFVTGPYNMKSLSVIVAISPRGIEGLQVFESTINTAAFNHFLCSLFRVVAHQCLHRSEKVFYFMDNAPCHKAKATLKHFEDAKQLGITNTPYTPEFNPAEYFINAHKQRMKTILSTKK